MVDVLSGDVTQLCQLSDAQSQFAERIRIKTINASRVVKAFAESVSEKIGEVQAVTSSYGDKIDKLTADRGEARVIVGWAIRDVNERDCIVDGADRKIANTFYKVLERADGVTEIVKGRLDELAHARATYGINSNID